MLRFSIEFGTDGNNEIVNLTPDIQRKLRDLNADGAMAGAGLLFLFAVGSTVALTTLEYEPGLVKHDFARAMQRLIPDDLDYEHEATWHDDNGHSHVRAALVGPSLAIPIQDGKMMTGEYQDVVLIDFDTRARRRTVIGTVMVSSAANSGKRE